MQPGVSGDTHARTARARRTWSSLVLGVLVLAAVVSTRWVRLNLSPSVPRGVYRLTAVREPLARGTLVVLPVPPAVQAWHRRWRPLLKPVAALAGETVCVAGQTLWIHGQSYGPVLEEADGKRLIQLVGCHTLQEGEVFLASRQPRSLDSRYFGVVRLSYLSARAIPLWVW